MKRRLTFTFALLCTALLSSASAASAADLHGAWDISVDDGTGTATIDYPMTISQAIIFLNVTEQRPTATGTVQGTGISPGPLVLWQDTAGSVFLGIADHPRNPTAINGLIVLNFEELAFSSWSATRVVTP